MSVGATIECPICAGAVGLPADVMLGELLECDDCGSELEVATVSPAPSVREAPLSAEDWGQ